MRSRTSNPPKSQRFQWKVARNFSEPELILMARGLAKELRPGDRVLLEGAMGAGKSTFARGVLDALGVTQPPEGSPTFAIAHEYQSSRGDVAHIDFYRLKSEEEIDEAGIPSYFWERKMIVLAEWVSSWPYFESRVLQTSSAQQRCWRVYITFCKEPEATGRDVIIERVGSL